MVGMGVLKISGDRGIAVVEQGRERGEGRRQCREGWW
jgi:hypothetical protein